MNKNKKNNAYAILFVFVSPLPIIHYIPRIQCSFLLIEKYRFVHFNLDHSKMRKKSYDVNHEEIRPNGETAGLKHITRNSTTYGTTQAASTEYISDRYYCSLYS